MCAEKTRQVNEISRRLTNTAESTLKAKRKNLIHLPDEPAGVLTERARASSS